MSTTNSVSTLIATSVGSSSAGQSSCSRKMRDNAAFIRPGDLIIIFASRDKTPIPLTVTRGEHVSNMFGHFPHDDMVGMPYGSKMISKNGRGYIYLLRPTPELWTLALPHRTQILYAPDMSFISMKLNMGPGSRVIEAGTGSGSFSHFIARTIGRANTGTDEHQSGKGFRLVKGDVQVPRNWGGLPNHLQSNLSRGRGQPRDMDDAADTTKTSSPQPETNEVMFSSSSSRKTETDSHVPELHGRLWSFEFHEPRVDKARSEFAAHGMDKTIVLNHRNVCKDGFGLTNAADCVFLDLPAPWEAIGHAVQALRRNTVTRICCFSPCIEQVLKTVGALNENGFTDVETFESLVRTHESHSGAGPEMSIDEAIQRIRVVEKRKETRRLIQIEKARSSKLDGDKNGAGATEGGADEKGDVSMTGADASSAAVEDEIGLKRKLDQDGQDAIEVQETNDSAEVCKGKDMNGSYQRGVQEGIAVTKKKARMMQQQTQQSQPIQSATVFSRPYYEMRGHTSYLTFATLLPRDMT
ncbi:related to GCD14 - translational repressor of GCN4 [Melanopsichium pennsylvanicum]|uniref:tRNA (adenine(58)-N(1))-methyltransferase catalytic subunit TRM61 n=2 Tax=Melanopsichium pennsylvanicum TaxID=63383 RepID=A0AAJ4XHM7_9BASI|nr:related to GCD14-translational repressor of GCN4 [Melanopsichium pennsylvanicum 4]SNX82308.1 related to GCD14 - translational repressor of GCN4 [Melanopsichium pennsylvanicum]